MRLSPSLRSFSDAVTSMGGAKHTSLKLLFSRAAFRVSVKADVSTEHREAGSKSANGLQTVVRAFASSAVSTVRSFNPIQICYCAILRGAVISVALSQSPVSSDCAFTRKPGLRVQSLHLPQMGLARRYLIGNFNEKTGKSKGDDMNLKAMMKERKITAGELAAKIGATERQVKGWMYGESEPGIRHMIALADALECTVDQLIRKGA